MEEATPATPAVESNSFSPTETHTTQVDVSHTPPEQDQGLWYQTLDPNSAKLLNDKDKQYKSFEDYVKSTHELRSKLSEKGIIPPGENATKEEKDAFLEEISQYIPSNIPDSYELKALEGLDIPEEQQTEMFSKFKEIGLSNEQADQILEFYGENVAKDLESFEAQKQEAQKEAEAQLKKEWGNEFEKRIERSSTILDRLGDGFSEYASQQGLFTQPEFIKLLDRIASAEAIVPKGNTVDKNQIKTRIDEILHDPKFLKGSFEERRSLGEELRSLRESQF